MIRIEETKIMNEMHNSRFCDDSGLFIPQKGRILLMMRPSMISITTLNPMMRKKFSMRSFTPICIERENRYPGKNSSPKIADNCNTGVMLKINETLKIKRKIRIQ
jgi:hypothetical protein